MIANVLVTGGAGFIGSVVVEATAAVYGEPPNSPITEASPLSPTNPYGETKRVFEQALAWYRKTYGLDYVSLRYFNAAGATSRNGEQHDPTPDGTCVRDYVHVSDLARAHVLALHALDTLSANALNLGSGGGSSVAQVIDTARRVTGRTIRVERGKRRPGDPGVLVASSEEARHVASWEPMRQDLALVIEDAWKWSLAHPDGYGSATHSCGAKAQ